MLKSHLFACPSCARHVRVSEAACPFCGATLDASFRQRPAPRAPAARLGRAALFALGTTTVGLAAACSSSSQGGGSEKGVDSGTMMGEPAYGAPARPLDAGFDVPMSEPAYGGSVPYEASAPVEAGTKEDAEPEPPDGGATPAYGAPGIDAG